MFQGNTTFNTGEIDIHIRTYRSLLKSSGSVKISQLIDSHLKMQSILHEKGNRPVVDIASFIYVLLRLPACMSNIKNIILGQSYSVFDKHGFKKFGHWKEVEAPGRRRKMYYDGRENLTVYIASVTDVDDMITLLTAFQIEWNKFHRILAASPDIEKDIGKILDSEDIVKIKNIWGKRYQQILTAIKHKSIDFTVKLLSGSYVEYTKATQHWWNHIATKMKNLNIEKRPIYFVSSNTHSLMNLLTKFALNSQNILLDYLHKSRDSFLISLWKEIKSGKSKFHKEYFLYYLSKKYARTHQDFQGKKLLYARQIGIHHIPAHHYLDIDVQVIELNKLKDERLKKSEALILNIDYPLGWAAYQVLTEIGQNVDNIRGIYIMGKAATLNGQIGDILIPETIFDQHSKNVYVITNAFSRSDLSPHFKSGSILDKQKTVCVKGTFFENQKIVEAWYSEGYTIIEMETGPYLNAAYEFVYYNRYVDNQFINLTSTPFDIGILHYVSDTPYSKAKNMGVRNLSYEGVEATYSISAAILRKIIDKEAGF